MAKHWKSFVKKEETPKKENEELVEITSLLSPEGKKTDKSLEDVAEFNSNLKSLIEEQKQLEDQMATLTGKKKDSNVDKRYQNDIKTIDQKKKEEQTATAKRQKRKESHRKKHDDRWNVEPSFTPKKKDIAHVPSISEKSKKAKIDSDFLRKKKASKPVSSIPKPQKKVDKPRTIVSKKKKPTTIIQYGEKVQKENTLVDNFTKIRKKSTTGIPVKTVKKPTTQKPKRHEKTLLKNIGKRKTTAVISKKKKPVATISDSIKKGTKSVTSFINNSVQKKQLEALQPIVKAASKKIELVNTTAKKVTKVAKTVRKVQKTGNDVQKGIEKVTSVAKSPALQKVSKGVLKATGIVNKVGKNLNKVTNTINTVQKTGNELQTGIEKVTSVVKSSELKKVSNGLSQGIGIVNKVGKKLNKVDKLFNTATKQLDKTQKVAKLFDRKLKAVDFISINDKKNTNGFDFDFLQNKQTKKEETHGFDVGNKKLAINLDTIKSIKKDVDGLKNVKKKKDSFSF
ncbi:hypothetical protein [Kordia sp.]|uniref:hypothetical protein n=1 Tax=Kordia sp. TaxID=1965332 RepID=UPI003D2BF097